MIRMPCSRDKEESFSNHGSQGTGDTQINTDESMPSGPGLNKNYQERIYS
jgi:hypothetical protein